MFLCPSFVTSLLSSPCLLSSLFTLFPSFSSLPVLSSLLSLFPFLFPLIGPFLLFSPSFLPSILSLSPSLSPFLVSFPLLLQDNFGFDLQAVEAATKKHEAIETDIAAYEERVQVSSSPDSFFNRRSIRWTEALIRAGID